MAFLAPDRIHLDASALTVLQGLLAAAAPEEGCALVLGRRQHSLWQLGPIWPCTNVWQPAEQRRCRFALDPRQQLQAQAWARQHQLEVLAAAHSHPSSPAIPSRTDRQLTPLPSLMLIQGLDGLACWWLEHPDLPPRRLPWRLAPTQAALAAEGAEAAAGAPVPPRAARDDGGAPAGPGLVGRSAGPAGGGAAAG